MQYNKILKAHILLDSVIELVPLTVVDWTLN